MMHDIPELDVKGLRQFGLMLASFMAGIFGLLLPWIWGFAMPLWPWVFGVVCLVWALAAPASIRPFYMAWMRVAMLIGEVVNRAVLGVVFYLVIFPMGFIMRLMGKDPMARKPDKSINSYRVQSKNAPKEHMEKPF